MHSSPQDATIIVRSQGPTGGGSDDQVSAEGPLLWLTLYRRAVMPGLISEARIAGLGIGAALEPEVVSVEVVDPRTTVPLDVETLVASAEKTGRVLVVDEGHAQYGVASHIAAVIAEHAFYSLDAPVRVIAARNVSIPFSPVLEDQTIPTVELVADAARRAVRGEEL